MVRNVTVTLTAVILLGLAGYSIVTGIQLRHRLDDQQNCLLTYITEKSETDKIRSAQVEKESRATRSVLLPAMTGKITTQAQFFKVGRMYVKAVTEVDAARARNPVKVFDPEKQCGITVKESK